MAKELRDVLGPFEKVTTVMGGQNYVTMSLIIPLIHGLAEGLEVSLRDSVDMKKFKRKIRSELESKFHLDSLEPILYPCSVLRWIYAFAISSFWMRMSIALQSRKPF